MALPGMPTSTPGTLGGSALDGPPPSAALAQGAATGTPPNPGGPGVAGMGVQPLSVSSGQMPPEVLTGVLQGGESMSTMLDSFAQILPDLGQDVAMVKQALLALMAKVLQAGASPTSPVSTGNQFPGGGLDKGGGPPSLG